MMPLKKLRVVCAHSGSFAFLQPKSKFCHFFVVTMDENNALLYSTDEELSSESEDHCLPVGKSIITQNLNYLYTDHTKLQFFITALTLILSSTILIIVLPLYLDTVNVKGDAYTMMFFTMTSAMFIFLFVILIISKIQTNYNKASFFKPGIAWSKIILVSLLYNVAGVAIVYALDRKRVVCHLQDPIKGIVLVFSFVNYFIFCKSKMGLRQIFSTTIIIVGIFISADYGLCNEFRCRGYNRETKADDVGEWSWSTHVIWTIIYICGLCMFSGYYTLLEWCFFDMVHNNFSSTLMATVSRLVSTQDSRTQTKPVIASEGSVRCYQSALHISCWQHLICCFFTIALFWTDLLTFVGKGSDIRDFLNTTLAGLDCHFTVPFFPKTTADHGCANVALYAWLFLIAYVVYTLSSMRLIILTQSAVFTVATASLALPFCSIWWSLMHSTPLKPGVLIWSPSVTGELICAILGLPVILIGLVLLCKSHFEEYKKARVLPSGAASGIHVA